MKLKGLVPNPHVHTRTDRATDQTAIRSLRADSPSSKRVPVFAPEEKQRPAAVKRHASIEAATSLLAEIE